VFVFLSAAAPARVVAAQQITFGVFFQRPGFAYPENAGTHWVVNGELRLKAIFDEWSQGRYVDGNCVDCSCFTMVALCSVGLDFATRQLTGDLAYFNEPFPQFKTNPVCPIGSDPTIDPTYQPFYWGWHQVCIPLGEPFSTGARVWCPTAAQKEDLDGNGYRNPPAYHPDHVWPQKAYWQSEHPQIPGAWLGLVELPEQAPAAPYLYGPPNYGGRGDWQCTVSTAPYTPPPDP